MDEELAYCFRAFQKLEADREQVLAQLAEWPPGCVNFRPAPNAWSAPHVLDHIVRSETCTIAGLRSGLLSPHTLGNEARPGIEALDRALRSNQSFQVPAGSDAIYPHAQVDLPGVAIRWEQTRAELNGLLKSLTPANACSGVFCHPFAGWMTFPEVLDHFSAHLFHHGFQLQRLRASWEQQP